MEDSEVSKELQSVMDLIVEETLQISEHSNSERPNNLLEEIKHKVEAQSAARGKS